MAKKHVTGDGGGRGGGARLSHYTWSLRVICVHYDIRRKPKTFKQEILLL